LKSISSKLDELNDLEDSGFSIVAAQKKNEKPKWVEGKQ